MTLLLSCVLGDVQWNKNPIFNLCLTIGYFWTTLLVMVILYIFIYGKYLKESKKNRLTDHFIRCFLGVASNLEKKSRENARKMSSLVGMAGKKKH